MIALIQRVNNASVAIEGQCVASIDAGMLALIGIEKSDSEGCADRLAEKLLGYRIFSDAQGRMNLDLLEAQGELLVVPQFTLAADTTKGRRPGFSQAANPKLAESLFDYLADSLQTKLGALGRGRFGADMQVSLTNDGPVTFWLQSES